MANDPAVLDISHWQDNPPFDDFARSGILGVILKCTQGTGYLDPTFHDRVAQAFAAGLSVASYHFLEHGNVADQMRWYLDMLQPDPGERVCLDHEADSDGTKPTLDDLREAVTILQADERNLQVSVYSGYLIKEQLDGYDPVLATTSLWLAQYGPEPEWPYQTWPTWTLWQYSDQGNVGDYGPVDVNRFNGSNENCLRWFGPAEVIPVPPEPEPEPERFTFSRGDYVETIKGARYCGVVDISFRTLAGNERVVVEAIDPNFEETLHVYPVAQLAPAKRPE